MAVEAGEAHLEEHVGGVRAMQPTFRAIDFRPPFLLRLGSILIDYIVLLVIPLSGLLFERLVGGVGFEVVSDRTLWLLAFVMAGVNVVLLPLVGGQTIGKMLTGIRIVMRDGGTVSVKGMVLRQTIGYLISIATLGLGLFIAGLNTSGRSLHDFIFGTVVVRARKTLVSV
ncbi:MAG: RDD family protein [Blastocatellia bacterium]|nr:RDD family protein [Blastocatellia bacterium]